MCSIQNNSGQDMSALTKLAKQFYPYAQEYLGFDKPAHIVYESDPENSQNPLGKTAHYQPHNYTVTLYVDGRHPKDLLRSLAHELVHHTQNCRGDLTPEKMGETGDGYAQTDGHLRKMEQEAYASMVMRDWEDQYKSKRRNNLNETIYTNKEYFTMSEHEKLIQRIVAEVMKQAKVTTESEEDEDVQEEGQGDRKDSRDNNQQGHRQGNAADGSAGQNLEEGEDEELDEAAQGSRQGGDRAKQQCEKQGKKMVAGKCVELDEGKYKRDDDEAVSEDDDKEVKEEGAAPDVSQHRGAGKTDTIEEGEDDEETDDLKETFRRRNNLLFEKLCNWSKK
jgi:hypothetical protein